MILEAAREVFIREGYENFSMRKLAEKIEYSPGTIYLHFKDKEALVNCLVEAGFEKLLKMLKKIPDGIDSLQSLKRKLRAYIDFGLRYPNHYHFAFMMRPTGGAERVRKSPHPAFDVLRNAVRRCMVQKKFRTLDVETTSQVLWATIHGVTSLFITHPNFPWVEKEKLIDRVLDTALDGLRRAYGRA